MRTADFATTSAGKPTFLNIGYVYPNPGRFVVVIWGSARGNFPYAPERRFLGRTICVSGVVTLYESHPEIVVSHPTQLSAAVIGPSTAHGTQAGLASEDAIVRSLGYQPAAKLSWCSTCTLHAVVAYCTAGASCASMHVFFFVGRRYIGTDTKAGSAQLSLSWWTGNEVAVIYGLYRSTDPMCCPSYGSALVRFEWTGRALVALDPIPSTSFWATGSRR